MRKVVHILGLCIVLVVCMSSPATAALTNICNGGDRVVYDGTNGTYWYPLLTNMTGMTKTQQQRYIDHQLNCKAYGRITDWEFATLDHMIALCDSMAETGMLDTRNTGPGVVYFLDFQLEKFFEPTNYVRGESLPYAAPLLFCGRTADEEALREDPDGSVAIRFGEGQFLIPYDPDSCRIRYDNDTNWVADDATYVIPPQGYPCVPDSLFQCSTWVVSTRGPVPAPGALLLGSIGAGFVGWLRSRKTL